MTNTAKAFIFDLNGTMIDDMEYHIRAWHHVLNNQLGADMDWHEVKSHMYGKNSELLIRVFGPDRFSTEEMDQVSLEKEKRYQEAFAPHLALIAGLPEFLARAEACGIAMAIGSAAIPFNIDFVLDRLDIRKYFKAVVSADDVKQSKPDPETYLKAATLLGVEPAACIVFEDAPKGVEAAQRAGMRSVVLTTMHNKQDFGAYSHVLHFVKDYTDPVLQEFF